MVKHVNRLIDKMNHLASGDFKTRLQFGEPICNHPTAREITESFNQMAEELEHTEMLRGDFVNNFSHEFKTPIVSVAGFAKLLKKGNLSEEQKGEYLDIIEEESLRLSEMATNVLNMTKIENQAILTDITTYNLSEQLRSCVLLLEKRWTGKKLELSLEFDEYDICASEELLKQVWINLIDNAIKYSPEYGLIVIKIREERDSYNISIANSGIEIPSEKRQKIFEKFYQADESHSSAGNGIGLSIVKSVIDLHGGQVSVDCKNGITTFHVIIAKEQ
jgi:signal transduction histidine kinase